MCFCQCVCRMNEVWCLNRFPRILSDSRHLTFPPSPPPLPSVSFPSFPSFPLLSLLPCLLCLFVQGAAQLRQRRFVFRLVTRPINLNQGNREQGGRGRRRDGRKTLDEIIYLSRSGVKAEGCISHGTHREGSPMERDNLFNKLTTHTPALAHTHTHIHTRKHYLHTTDAAIEPPHAVRIMPHYLHITSLPGCCTRRPLCAD